CGGRGGNVVISDVGGGGNLGLAKMPDEGRMMLAGINLLILLMFAAELICRWCKLGTNGLYREWGLDFLVVAASLVCGFGNAFDIYNTVSWMYPYMSALQVLRILSTRKEFRSLVETFFECLPMVLEMVTVTFCILYFYSVVGMELFSTSIVGDVPYCSKGGDSPVNTGDAKKDICLDDIENFQTPGHAMLALFQIITSNNWNDVMYPNVVANIKISGTGFPGYFYFISFFTLMVLLVINLMTCLVIDIYESRRDVIEREGQKAQQLRYAQEAGGEVVYTLVQVRDWTRKLMGRRPHETQSEALEQSIITLEVLLRLGVSQEVPFDRNALRPSLARREIPGQPADAQLQDPTDDCAWRPAARNSDPAVTCLANPAGSAKLPDPAVRLQELADISPWPAAGRSELHDPDDLHLASRRRS
ncbi:mitochondrial thiamine pyrophosphate transporter, partial [Cymbomonas tetramitiformis]